MSPRPWPLFKASLPPTAKSLIRLPQELCHRIRRLLMMPSLALKTLSRLWWMASMVLLKFTRLLEVGIDYSQQWLIADKWISGRGRVQICSDAWYHSETKQWKGQGCKNTDATNDVHAISVGHRPPKHLTWHWLRNRLRRVKDPDEIGPDRTSLKDRMQPLMKKIADDIMMCGSECDVYMRKSFIGT